MVSSVTPTTQNSSDAHCPDACEAHEGGREQASDHHEGKGGAVAGVDELRGLGATGSQRSGGAPKPGTEETCDAQDGDVEKGGAERVALHYGRS